MAGEMAFVTTALKFYADGDHFLLADPDAWETCSGEPINFQHDAAGTASVEDGSIAKIALARLVNAIEYTACVSDGLSVGMSQEEAEQHADCLSAAPVQHPDDAAVDRFAVAMKAKLAASREKGRHGWQNATAPHLSSLLHEHMYKGDPLDVGNLAMMLHQNGQAIELPHDARRVTPPVQQVSAPASRDTLTLAYRLITSELKTLANGSAIDRYKAAQCEKRAMIDAPAAPAADAIIDSERLAFMLADRRKVVVERLVGCGYSVYVKHGVMGEKQYPAVAFKGDSWEDDSVETLAVKRKAIDVAITAHRAAATEPGAAK